MCRMESKLRGHNKYCPYCSLRVDCKPKRSRIGLYMNGTCIVVAPDRKRPSLNQRCSLSDIVLAGAVASLKTPANRNKQVSDRQLK